MLIMRLAMFEFYSPVFSVILFANYSDIGIMTGCPYIFKNNKITQHMFLKYEKER